MLATGNGLHPVQWLTYNFLHSSLEHLLFNMLFFWAFGLVVEGKIGLFKSLAVYLGIGILSGFIVQLLMLGNAEVQHCLGASGIVSGMMFISVLWAPEHSIECTLLIWLRPFSFDWGIKWFAGFYVGLDILSVAVLASLGASVLSTPFLHSVGALTGLFFGLLFLKRNWVDCEYWDLFSVWHGLHQMTEKEREAYFHSRELSRMSEEEKNEAEEREQNQIENFRQQIRTTIQLETTQPAMGLMQKFLREHPQETVPEKDFQDLIRVCLKNNAAQECLTLLKEYLFRYKNRADTIYLTAAQLLLGQRKPHAAKRLLTKMVIARLNQSQMQFLQKLAGQIEQTIEQMDANGEFEINDGDEFSDAVNG